MEVLRKPMVKAQSSKIALQDMTQLLGDIAHTPN